MHVLVCDDDAATRCVITRLLTRSFGCTVTKCVDGLGALECVGRERFDLVLLDIEMPVVNGIEVVSDYIVKPLRAEAVLAKLGRLKDVLRDERAIR